MEEKIIVGLDIGTTKICAIVGRKNEFGKLEVLGMGKAESEGVVKGIVFNIDKTNDQGHDGKHKGIRQEISRTSISFAIINCCRLHPSIIFCRWVLKEYSFVMNIITTMDGMQMNNEEA